MIWLVAMKVSDNWLFDVLESFIAMKVSDNCRLMFLQAADDRQASADRQQRKVAPITAAGIQSHSKANTTIQHYKYKCKHKNKIQIQININTNAKKYKCKYKDI